MSEQNWKATGLTCDHCAQSVTKNLMLIDGMSSVNVEVKPNEVSSIQTVGAREFTPEEISRAMAQAGKYFLSS
ncbi:MAG TPA: heavy-metal-associated domain-containing protein [Candidatus Paceibacterota bacterium]|nr:heavy-metal-associated domain-containing protein [Candidatus Paceibacterota bacterium]